MSPSRGLRVALALGTACAAAAFGQAGSRNEFRSGYLAFERGRWAEVESHMRAAVAERPQEDARDLVRIGGTFSKAYLPWYYLGVARAELGRCREAVEAFDRSESQRQIQSLPEHADLVERRAQCAALLPAEPEPAPSPEPVGAHPVPTVDVPPGLLAAATAYFSGDYLGCLGQLAELAPEPPALLAQVELFRAAAEFALDRAGDTDGGERLHRARLAARRYRAAAGGVAPGERYFSPAFLAFLAEP